ncbi:hypothetical protein [Halocatena marina]|uniref:Uncharacterized protein n=1 Tax=Halocatena marina TaxID=2934937 RepID=A0ABD5YWM5_9EURY|nr:hypothetical protein [Halocatena marina]
MHNESTELASALTEFADNIVRCRLTTFGSRFAEEDFETHVDDTFQTTLAYWQRVLSVRHPARTSATTPKASAHGANQSDVS